MSEPISNKQILIWEIIGVCFIIVAGGPLHELFEQSGRWWPVALIAAVNESIWEHLKMFFWPALLFAFALPAVQRGYVVPDESWLKRGQGKGDANIQNAARDMLV